MPLHLIQEPQAPLTRGGDNCTGAARVRGALESDGGQVVLPLLYGIGEGYSAGPRQGLESDAGFPGGGRCPLSVDCTYSRAGGKRVLHLRTLSGASHPRHPETS
ncbi:Hypothetical protein AA314_04070 [Archangium gephyra]|uniref:Uncharacterized protein n=1 Tax=Archangium gephyra TaxID=48 RepID=A0AAC8Q7Q8_9BACT|nr:Hypothetical protein AA314_04070 [Archangium gephyra]